MGVHLGRIGSRLATAAVGLALVAGVVAPAGADPGGGSDNSPGQAKGGGQSSGAVERDPSSGRITTDPLATDLTAAGDGDPADIALAYLRANAKGLGLTTAHLDTLYVHKEFTLTTGATAVHFGQKVDGLRVRDGIVTAVVQEDGSLASIAGFLATGRGTPGAQLTAHQALDVAAKAQDARASRPLREADNKAADRRTYPNVYAEGVFRPTPVSTELVWHPAANGRSLRLAWLTDIESSGQAWYETVVDAKTGAVIEQSSRYAHAEPEGDVFREQHPEAVAATQQITPFTGLDGSWVSGTTTSGNNVNAYLDRDDDDNNNEYQPTAADQHFNYPFTDAWRATADVDSAAALNADRDAIITQLFYYTNVMHDWLYGHGFDEASGNFQVDNFGRGGSGGDPVLAEAQDGYNFGCDDGDGTPNETEDRCQNNANFGTPGDGASPRMQMYMWIPPDRPFRDGDMDGDVIAHEYGHGVSSRLVGGGNLGYTGSDQRGALGEGWSDVVSYLKWGDAVIGEYVTGNATTGIRSVAYDNSNLDFQDYNVNAGSGHGPGQIWATVLYDIRAQIPGGAEAMASLVLDGMKATPADPNFVDARNGLLTADAGANRCLIWSAFAGRGLGTGSNDPGLDTVPIFSDDIPAECLPTADANGPYTTDEGANVTLDGTGSTEGTHASAGAIVAHDWDLDNDGQYDDATGDSPSFTTVGQDGVYPIGLQVTDEFGNTATDTSQVTVDNVAPIVEIDPITGIDEGGTVTVSGTVTDPGWLDPLTATISWGDGAAAVALPGTLENLRPDATLTFSIQHQYGDDGTFEVEVCGYDDDTSTCDTENAVVDNVDPTAAIDTSGEQVYDGVSAFILEKGEELTVPVDSTDPGSDDLTTTWDWDDGTTTDERSLVNPPAVDPLMSPSVQPRDITLQSSHTYGEACLYELSVTTADDDGGLSPVDTAAVIITGNATESKGHGWWLNQYRNKPPNDFTPAELQCYLDIVGYLSLVFDEDTDASTRAKAAGVLNAPAKAPADVIFDQQALGAWLNFAYGSVSLATPVDTDGDGLADSTFGDAMFAAETVRMNPATSSNEIKAQKDIVERIALQSGS